MRLSIIGLGKLGLPLFLTFASQGYNVVGYDINEEAINKLQSGISTSFEPLIQDLLIQNRPSISISQAPEDVIQKSNTSFIVVPTPSNKDGSFSSRYITEAINTFIPYIKQKEQKHTFIITSTVSPGTMEYIIKPLIEKGTGKIVGKEIGLCYSPEFIALGSVVQNLSNPDFLLIGESDKKTGDMVERLRKSICLNTPKIIRTNWINAELIKLALNAYITTKISFANMISRISERIEGADSAIILNAIGQDKRVGAKYLKGGLGYGGPCFPRDNISLYSTLKKIGLDIDLPLIIDTFNRKQIEYIYKIIEKNFKTPQTIGILGLSYKPETDVIEESQGILLAKKLVKKKISVLAFDPLAINNAKKVLKNVQFQKSTEDCVQQSDIIVLTTPWSQFNEINWDKYTGKIVIDCWRMLDVSKYNQTINTFIQLGKYIPTT